MALRRGIILGLVFGGGLTIVVGTPVAYRLLAAGATLFTLAYIYAQLTRPKS